MTRSAFSRQAEQFREMMRAERERAGLTQTMLSQQLERPQSYVSKYERGERRLDVIEFLEVARIVGFDASRFIERLQQGV
jgi:ribosome-binding protein aMBF1 (putative translation factor)